MIRDCIKQTDMPGFLVDLVDDYENCKRLVLERLSSEPFDNFGDLSYYRTTLDEDLTRYKSLCRQIKNLQRGDRGIIYRMLKNEAYFDKIFDIVCNKNHKK